MQGWRHSSRRRPLLLGGLAGLVLAGPATASDQVYTVANYPVDAVAENAVAAKKQALADGQQAAFRSLLKRLVPVTSWADTKRFEDTQAAELIDTVRVRSERNSATEYLGTYDFTFRAKSIRDMLRREGIPFTDEQAPPVTLVPIWQGEPAEQAAWTGSWKGLDLENSVAPIKIEGVRKDLPRDHIAAAVLGDAGALRSFATFYKTDRVLVAAADPNAAPGRLAVTLAGVDAVGPFVLKRQYQVDPADPGYARELAAVVAQRIIEGRWTTVHTHATAPAGSGAGATDLLLSVEFRGMSEWQDISRKLSATPGVEELDVAGLSARGARVTLRYAEGAERLAEQLAQQGLILRNNGGTWVLSAQ
ncbi:MAG: DUF2066 domain-containing protein [Hyphomicrobiaceae bacterium]|nr:DUF2066 domain-containing protein [Hyphomicrobiaceae bacterium]